MTWLSPHSLLYIRYMHVAGECYQIKVEVLLLILNLGASLQDDRSQARKHVLFFMLVGNWKFYAISEYLDTHYVLVKLFSSFAKFYFILIFSNFTI